MTDSSTLFCTFRIGEQLFGVPVLDVREVTTETGCTRIPHAPPEVAGYVNIRGQIYLALNLRMLLGLSETTEPVDRRLVLFKLAVGPAFGILVDEIRDIVGVPESVTETLVSNAAERLPGFPHRGLVSQICTLPHELLTVLDPRRFLPSIEESLERL